jgi:predicted Ser/Thr protein kinase
MMNVRRRRTRATIRRSARVIGTTFNQRFTLEHELGRGGMGAVYRATDQVLGRRVAIKVLKEHSGAEVGARLRLEAQILARLLHENIVRLYDFGAANDTHFLVMEEVDGPSFARRWRQVPLNERLRIIAQVADALDYAHHQGVIHRDIKPGNVLLTSADAAKLSDFGLSLIAEQVQDTDAVRGTPHFMSPEQAQARKLDHRSDLYSLGVMLYECAAGECPFHGQPLSIIAQHVNNVPQPPRTRNPAVSRELEALILALLAKDPAGRPSSGRAVAQALRDEIARLADGPTRAPAARDGVLAADSFRPGPSHTPTVAMPSAPPAAMPRLATPRGTTPLVREMLEEILNEPLILTPDERYLCGHYLAFLLGGSRRRGLLLRRPSDARNADRARLLLAMTGAMMAGGGAEAVARAARLLDERTEVRAALNPVVVMKYLASRDTAPRRKRFRLVREQLRDASPYAQKQMADAQGLLNPGLMPQELADLRKVAPERTEVDDLLVGRWNRVAEVWRDQPELRQAVLRYAARPVLGDPASEELWPEVVYPLIERARRQRQFRPQYERVWDYLCARVLHVPDAGVRLDRAISRAVPRQVVAALDEEIDDLVDDSEIDMEPAAHADARRESRLADQFASSGISLAEIVTDLPPDDQGVVGLVTPDPVRFTQGQLRELWQEAVAAMRQPGARSSHRNVAIGGPYRLAVVPSVRGRSAGTVAIQGMANKQIEMLTPSLRLASASGRPIVAVWVYHDNSLAITYTDFQGSERYILWHASNAQQFNFGDAAELNHMAYHLGLEAPDQLDRALSKRFRPRNPTNA